MIELLQTILDVIVALARFVVQLVQDLVTVARMLIVSVAHLPQIFQFLPSACIAVVMAVFSIVIIYKVLGREG